MNHHKRIINTRYKSNATDKSVTIEDREDKNNNNANRPGSPKD